MLDLRFTYDLDRPQLFREVLKKKVNYTAKGHERAHRKEWAESPTPDWKPMPDTTPYRKRTPVKDFFKSLIP